MRRARTPWFAEHISLSHFPGGDTRHFFLPYLDASIAADVIRNATQLQAFMEVPMLLENAPRLFDASSAPINEGKFIADIVNACHCGYLLDLSSARKTCNCLGYSIDEYIATMPLDVLTELHVGNIETESQTAIDLIRNYPIKAVTLEANLSAAKDSELRSFVEHIDYELRKRDERLCIPIPASGRDPSDVSHVDARAVDLSAPVKFSRGTSIAIYDDHIFVHSLGKSPTLLPPAATMILAEIMLGKPLGSILQMGQDIGSILAVLSNHTQHSDERGLAWGSWGLAEAFHQSLRSTVHTRFETKDAFEARLSKPESQALRPLFAKEYPLHPYIQLPLPTDLQNDSLAATLLGRRTCRQFHEGVISLERISNVLFYSCGWTASGVQRVGGMPVIRKTSPSPGSMASVEVYLLASKVNDLLPGIYHYSLVNHGLELLDGENPSSWLVQACGDQNWVVNCSAAILLCGVPARLAWKYSVPKAYQAMQMEVGHISQSALLCSTAEGLGCFCTAALREDMFETRIQLQPLEETPLLLIGMGRGIDA
jgi:SagB-type dehydrogenase family enzyme